MKTEIFTTAMTNHNKIRVYYDAKETIIEPYMVSFDKAGRKILYARDTNSNTIETYQYSKIANIKIMYAEKFSPIVLLSPIYN